jgi:hypothetical protein
MPEFVALTSAPNPPQGRPITDNQADTKAFHIVADMEDDLRSCMMWPSPSPNSRK